MGLPETSGKVAGGFGRALSGQKILIFRKFLKDLGEFTAGEEKFPPGSEKFPPAR